MAKTLKQEIAEAYQQVINQCNSLSDTEDILFAFESYVSWTEVENRQKEEYLENLKDSKTFWKDRWINK